MTNTDIRQMIQRCIDEITMLRGQIAELAPKAAAYDSINQILGLLPKPSQGYDEDIIWRLKDQLRGLEPTDTPAEEPSA